MTDLTGSETTVKPDVPTQEQAEDLVHALAPVVKESKAGYKTTEFWLAVAGLVAVNANGLIMTLPDRYQAIATAVIGGLYVISRGVAKSGVPDIAATPPA